MLTLAALQAFILVLILLIATLAPGFVRSIYHDRLPERAALAALSAFIAYELFAAGLVTIFLRRGRNYPVFGRYANALVETSFPTVLLFLLAGYLPAPPIVFGTWPALLYFLFIILSTLRLDFAAFGLHRRGRRGRTLRPRLCHAASWLARRGPELQHRLSSDAQRWSCSRPGCSRARSELTIKSHFERALAAASARDRVTNLFGQHVSPQVVDRLLAIGAAELERDAPGLRHVRRHPRLHRRGARAARRPRSSRASTPCSRSWSRSSTATTAS